MLTQNDAIPSCADSAREARLLDCVKQFQQLMRMDTAPTIAQFVSEHADLAPDLQECLEALVLIGGIEGSNHSLNQLNPRSGSHTQSSDEKSQPTIGDFQILRELGRGGMGIVYEALQLSLGRRVALKVLPLACALHPAQLQRFRNEAQAAASLHHPHIVPVFAVGCDRDTNYYAMQLIEGYSCAEFIQESIRSSCASSSLRLGNESGEGKSLGSRLAKNIARKQRLRQVVEWVCQAAEALDRAHQYGVVHRDIKPANLLIDRSGNLWVTDFGLAQFNNESKLTKTGDLVGTLRYMSPEQIEGGNRGQDHRTDIYALGATLFELLTLRPLIAAKNYSDIVREITHNEIPSARSIRPDIPRELAIIIQKATAKLPEERYSTMRDFADDLTRWLCDEPIRAKPPSALERLAKWHRRHWLLVNCLTLSLTACTGTLAWTTQAVVREQTKTQQALDSERAERKRTEQTLREAKRAVDVFSELGENELVNLPELRKLRGEFLTTSLKFYRDFLALQPDNSSLEKELTTAAEHVQSIVEDIDMLNSIDSLLMLRYDKVQREIEVDTSTWETLAPIVASLNEQLQMSFSGAESNARMGELKNTIREARLHVTDSQLTRLRQIYWQNILPMTFCSLEVAAELDLSAEQRERIQQVISEEGGKGKPAAKPRGPRPAPQSRSQLSTSDTHRNTERSGDRIAEHEPRPRPASPWASEQVRRTVDRILELLTEEQRSRWNNLIGTPF